MSEWKISSNRINGETIWQVYRLLNENEVDHSGNREYFRGVFKKREDAEATAKSLNGTPENKDWRVAYDAINKMVATVQDTQPARFPLCEALYDAGYRRADEVRREAAQDILQRIGSFPLLKKGKGINDLTDTEKEATTLFADRFLKLIKEIAKEYGVEAWK